MDRTSIVQSVRKWGGPTSDAVLDPACQFFTLPNVEGLVGYRNENGCAVVYGDPVCAKETIPLLVHAFHHHCQADDKNVIYIAASESFAEWAISNVCKASIQFGEQIFINPANDPRKREGTHASLVRRKVRHALSEGSTVHEYLNEDDELEKAIENVGITWLRNRRGPQIYISHVRLFEDRIGKRYFYALHEDQVVGVFLLNQMQSLQGWHLNHLMVTPDSPHGIPELLIIHAIETLHMEGCNYLTLGMELSSQIGKIEGLGKISTWLTHQAIAIAKTAFRLDGKRKFWEKFHPESKPCYLIFSEANISLKEIRGLVRALNISL